ncbi:MAG: hypothetical protein EU532_13080, partial [Promethearchaeota archaeon]
MKRFVRIPKYSMEIQFKHNSIHCYDLISKEIVASEPYEKIHKIVGFRKPKFNTILILDKEDNEIDHIKVDLVSERSRVATNAGYVLDLSMDSPTHGYYFGPY